MRFIYGYRVARGKMEIHEGEAAAVMEIFSLYIGGLGFLAIAKELKSRKVPAMFGGRWNKGSVAGILKNEKYTGDSLLQKTFVPDHLTKKKIPNKGQLPQYYAEGTHPAIIDSGAFEKAQEILKARRGKCRIRKKPAVHDPFTGKILCGNCGKKFKRKTVTGRRYWQCPTFLEEGKAVCPAKQIPENILMGVAAEALGLAEFDDAAFLEQVASIHVPETGRLIFLFKDGRQAEKEWQNRSRRESWTDEMKDAARKKAKEAYKHGKR
jgi:hypothetical protein